jgi:hypothetical protein
MKLHERLAKYLKIAHNVARDQVVRGRSTFIAIIANKTGPREFCLKPYREGRVGKILVNFW